jgi:hypothetical protein
MIDEKHRTQSAFYAECAALLDTTHDYEPWIGRPPNRWNNRKPGNGRYPGFGCVRWFGPTHIHVMLHTPMIVNKVARSSEEAIAILKSAMASPLSTP